MSKSILLADDSVTIQKVVELTFMDEDYRVTAVGNGEDALSRLAETDPDLIIADVHMPGANGYEVCRRAKAERPGVPVMLLVGTFEPFDEQQAKTCGAEAFLKKPFDSQELLRLVESLLARSARAAAAVPPPVPSRPSEDDATLELSSYVSPPEPLAAAAAAPAPAPAPEAAPSAPTAAVVSGERLSDEEVDRVARRVVEILSEKIVREVAWEVVPDLAELVIKDRLRELEAQVE